MCNWWKTMQLNEQHQEENQGALDVVTDLRRDCLKLLNSDCGTYSFQDGAVYCSIVTYGADLTAVLVVLPSNWISIIIFLLCTFVLKWGLLSWLWYGEQVLDTSLNGNKNPFIISISFTVFVYTEAHSSMIRCVSESTLWLYCFKLSFRLLTGD